MLWLGQPAASKVEQRFLVSRSPSGATAGLCWAAATVHRELLQSSVVGPVAEHHFSYPGL